jgi:nitrogen fixation protein FixH
MTAMEIIMTSPKKFKLNWGWGITGVYLVFVTGILYMVWRTTQERQDLVAEDYYAQELKYQDKIDASKRAAALSSPVVFDLKGQVLHLAFPKEFEGKTITGDVLVYYPADSRKDVKVPVKLVNNAMDLTMKVGSPGMHILELSWQEGNTTYYQESNLTTH